MYDKKVTTKQVIYVNILNPGKMFVFEKIIMSGKFFCHS